MASSNWRSWSNLVDSKVNVSSRWHSSHEELAPTPDRIGDFLVARLRRATRSAHDQETIGEWGRDLHDQLVEYEEESRLLVKLAHSGRVVQVLTRGVKTTLGVLNEVDTAVEAKWIQELHRERREREELYRRLLRNGGQLSLEMGDDNQQLEVLTLMKHGIDKFMHVLTDRELDLISEVYDTVTRRVGIVVGEIPSWFATSERQWSGAVTSVIDEGEEACLRQVGVWAKLHHPHVRKLYGACHVGTASVIHELSVSRYHGIPPWWYMFGCALGLKYVHERGLAHRHLTIENLHSAYEFKGILSGLGLIRTKSSESELRNFAAASDVQAFGLAMFKYLVDCFSANNSELDDFHHDQRLPRCRPNFFSEEQWSLLVRMCADDPADRMSMIEVVHKLESIQKESHDDIWGDDVESKVEPEFVDELDSYMIPAANATITDILQDTNDLCDEIEDFIGVNRPVYDRLLDVYTQLSVSTHPLPVALVEDFSSILWRFFLRLEERSQGEYNSVATLCAANTVANRNYSVHHDIDRIILSTPFLQSSPAVHCWQPTWEQTYQWQQEALRSGLKNPLELLDNLENENDIAEAFSLLQFEGESLPGVYIKDDKLLKLVARAANVPRWLIPPHQIELGRHLADGSFGAVYLGKWFNTDVVVKQVLTNQANRKNREQFFHEVNLWASLNHDNLIKLYGACHEGQPYFVCEQANQGTLIKYLEGRRHFAAWRSIWEAAKGLQYLHERGIIHGDLKGNNILVCDATAKLADFGLSVFARSSNPDDDAGALGAFRWKAPECLAGAGPTFESDIYSFAMCIIEAVSGDFPWGKSMSDSVVKLNVLEKKILPPRPRDFNDNQWDLITRMCSYYPERRPNAAALVHILWKFA
ncbi:unnamed protein product [Phytophthora fragariaefolia]|uniref:Unnamed protein product n=1 Tax=Phytophthora fragariaefolia TaxID=1490495 RepID=A0A9W6WR93_9STRA|nr:unnamed protein product [Phytophthora fragariaefolia]